MQITNHAHRHGPIPLASVLPEGPRVFAPAQFGRGLFFCAHFSLSSCARMASESFCKPFASCVNTRRQKVRSAAVAHVLWSVCAMAGSLIFFVL